MRKAYLIAIANLFATRQQIQDCLDKVPGIYYWYACLPNCVFFISDRSANEIAANIDAYFGEARRKDYIITEMPSGNRQGWLPRDAWYMIEHPDSPVPPKNS